MRRYRKMKADGYETDGKRTIKEFILLTSFCFPFAIRLLSLCDPSFIREIISRKIMPLQRNLQILRIIFPSKRFVLRFSFCHPFANRMFFLRSHQSSICYPFAIRLLSVCYTFAIFCYPYAWVFPQRWQFIKKTRK